MPSRLSIFLLCLVVLMSVMGCQQQPPPPPPTPAAPPPPPEPSPDDHASKARSTLGPLLQDGPVAPAAQDGALSAFGSIKTQLSATENGRQGLSIVQRDVEDAIKKAKEKKRFRKTVTLCKVYETLQPGSDRYSKTKHDAELLMSAPEVTITGFVQTGGDLYAFIEVKGADGEKTETFKVREGEEFYKPAKVGNQPNSSEVLRLVRIIGNQQECEIEYKPASLLRIVPGPRTRARY